MDSLIDQGSKLQDQSPLDHPSGLISDHPQQLSSNSMLNQFDQPTNQRNQNLEKQFCLK